MEQNCTPLTEPSSETVEASKLIVQIRFGLNLRAYIMLESASRFIEDADTQEIILQARERIVHEMNLVEYLVLIKVLDIFWPPV